MAVTAGIVVALELMLVVLGVVGPPSPGSVT